MQTTLKSVLTIKIKIMFKKNVRSDGRDSRPEKFWERASIPTQKKNASLAQTHTVVSHTDTERVSSIMACTGNIVSVTVPVPLDQIFTNDTEALTLKQYNVIKRINLVALHEKGYSNVMF